LRQRLHVFQSPASCRQANSDLLKVGNRLANIVSPCSGTPTPGE
jgi:hypothetical protein